VPNAGDPRRVDVSSLTTARVRELSRGSRHKTDVINAVAASRSRRRPGRRQRGSHHCPRVTRGTPCDPCAQRVRGRHPPRGAARPCPWWDPVSDHARSTSTMLRSVHPSSSSEKVYTKTSPKTRPRAAHGQPSSTDIERRLSATLDDHRSRCSERRSDRECGPRTPLRSTRPPPTSDYSFLPRTDLNSRPPASSGGPSR
jgi:hypothetical protein